MALLFGMNAKADRKIDSIQALIKNEKVDTSKIQLYRDLGVAYEILPDFYHALECYETAAALAEKYAVHRQTFLAYGSILNCCFYMGDYPRAMKTALKQLKLAQRLNDKGRVANANMLLGFIYLNQENPPKARYYFEKYFDYAKKNGNQGMLAHAYTAMANVYETEGKPQEALRYLSGALDIHKKLDAGSKDDAVKSTLASTYNNIASLYKTIGDYKQALEYSQLSIELGEKYPTNKFELSNYYILNGNLHTLIKNYDKAAVALGKGMALAKSITHKEDIKGAYQGYAELYAQKGDYKNAFEYYKKYAELKDTLLNDKNNKAMAEMNARFESAEKDKALIKKDAEISQRKTESKHQARLLWIFVLGFILVVVLAGFILRSYNQKRRANIEISKQKHIIEEKNKEVHDSITYAKRIQSAILPPEKLVKEMLPESFILYKPKDIVSGDFYFMEQINIRDSAGGAGSGNRLILFAAADCTGHGVPGAMVSVVGSTALHRALAEFGLTQPASILDKLTELVEQTFAKSENEVKDGMDISLCALDKENKKLHWSGAHNPLWVVKRHQASDIGHGKGRPEIIEIKGDKQPIGKFDARKPFTHHEIQLQQGDTIYIFTDGFADQFGGPQGKKYKYKQLQELLLSVNNLEMENQKSKLEEAFLKWKGNLEQVDDVLIIGIRV
ncbi:MAG TPA: tetratricopeptide repeat protein [Flavobacteriales bacterium]|nr:tetratricopeptide repeat protein [Flavobacteriales bacterium]